MIVFALASLVSSQCSGSACPDPCDACAFDAVTGTNPSPDEWMSLFASVSQRAGAADLPAIDNVEVGPARERQPAEFPCRLLPAIGATESSIRQFCSGSNLTVISFDCGFGVMQVTSGAAGYPGLEARADINVAAGADILAAKWNGNESFGGEFGDRDPTFVESWYFAVWAYNGFVYSNNPNNPNYPANRPPFNGPSSLSRGSYPYQELVWGYLRNPLDGMWQPLEVTYPDPATIPDQSGLFSITAPLPEPSHADPCVEECPPSGCPPEELRTLILDDADSSFSVTGAVDEHAEGGFRDRFLSAALAPAGAPTVVAHFEGVAPSSGTFDVGGFIPLDPATCDDVRVRVDAHGAPKNFSYTQNVNGGFFQTLGQVVLREGDTVVVEVTNDSSDTNAAHRVGMDAFRFSWRGDGVVESGGACGDDVECAGDLVCNESTCGELAPGEGEGEGEGDGGEGDAGEGEGEGEGDDGNGRTVIAPPVGCTCGSPSSSPSSAAVLAFWLVALRLVRRR